MIPANNIPVGTVVKVWEILWIVAEQRPFGCTLRTLTGPERTFIPDHQSLHVVKAPPTWMP